jgi:acyl-CoA synthetase (AMP-forming)/AMP-acid ligase II
VTSPIPDSRPAGLPGSGPPARDLIELVRDACQADPGIPALIFEDGVSISRARLWDEVESFAGYLSSRIEPGDRVAVMMPNRTEFMVTWLAVTACRGILVALNPAARSHDAGHVLRDSSARIAVVDGAYAPRARPAGRGPRRPDQHLLHLGDDRPAEGLRGRP